MFLGLAALAACGKKDSLYIDTSGAPPLDGGGGGTRDVRPGR